MIVMKFGGTSLQDAACLARAASIVAQHRAERPLVVVSAVGGVTRRLLQLGEAATERDRVAVERDLAAIEALHRGILHGIDAGSVSSRAPFESVLRRLHDSVTTISEQAAYSPAAQDALLSCGERLSAVLFAAAADAGGLAAERVDAASVVITDARFRHARPIRAEIDRRAPRLLLPLIESGSVPVVEGFIGATEKGETTTMGFEASDLTASLLGAALRVSEVQIWTDVPGMLTTGHPAVAQPLVVSRLSFDEAAELALFGAKVLHPDSIAPARDRGIPVRILHARNPGGDGTWITATEAGEERPRIKAIAVTEDPTDESFDTVRSAIEAPPGEGGWSGRSVVCPVGTGIGTDDRLVDDVLRRVGEASASLRLPRRSHAIPVVVPRSKLGAVVRRLHDAVVAGR
jgi:aspartate kinase